MASDSRTLKLAILGEVKDLSASLNKGTNEVNTFGDKITKFGKVAGAAFLAAGIAATAFAVKFAKDAIVAGEAAATANARIGQINESMGLFGASTEVVNKRLIALAESTARNTGVDTNAIKATQAKLLTFKELAATANEISGNFDRATQAAIDLGAAGFGTAETNAVQLGKALNDPIKGITALTRSGVTFTESEQERIKILVESNKVGEAQNLILAAIETQVGGTAEATANATDKMKIGFQQVSEKIGIALLPLVEKFSSFLLDTLFPTIDKYILPAVQRFVDAIGGEKGISKALSGFISAAKSIFIPVFQGIKSAFDNIKGAVSDNKEEFQALLEFIQKYVAPFLGGVFKIAIQGIGTAISTVVNVVGALIKGFQTLISLGSKIGGAIGGMFGGGRAAGGPVAGGTTYLVGEKGPELFTPAGSGTIVPNGAFGGKSGNVINITVNGAIDPISTARQITQILNREATLSGTFNKVGASLLVGA
jgi:hypothetical protein